MYIPADTESGAIHEDSNEAGACKGMSHYFYACVTNDWFFVYIYICTELRLETFWRRGGK